MLLDRAASLATKINTFQKLKNTKEESEQFATRATQFAHVSMLVSRLRATLKMLDEAGGASRLRAKRRRWAMPTRRGSCARRSRWTPPSSSDPPFDLKHGFTDRLNNIASAGRQGSERCMEGLCRQARRLRCR